MNDESVFAVDGAWSNGHYELLIDVAGGVPAPEQVVAVAAALWTHPVLDGPYSRCDLEPREQTRSHPGLERQYGVAAIADGALVPCATYAMSSVPDFLPNGEPFPPDVLIFDLPLASLQRRVWREIGGFPFQRNQDTRPWQEPLEEWFAGLAVHTYAQVPFKLAVTDFEVAPGYDRWRSWADGSVAVPDERRVDLHVGSGADLKRIRRTIWV